MNTETPSGRWSALSLGSLASLIASYEPRAFSCTLCHAFPGIRGGGPTAEAKRRPTQRRRQTPRPTPKGLHGHPGARRPIRKCVLACVQASRRRPRPGDHPRHHGSRQDVAGRGGAHLRAPRRIAPRAPTRKLLKQYEHSQRESDRIWAREMQTEFEADDTRAMVRKYSKSK